MNDTDKLEILRDAWSEVDTGRDCGCSQPCACAYEGILAALRAVFGDED